MVLRKDELEVQLKDEHQQIRDGVLRDDSPLDFSPEFQKLCDACRIGDLKGCQEAIATGVNINARDLFDYTPLILVSLLEYFYIPPLTILGQPLWTLRNCPTPPRSWRPLRTRYLPRRTMSLQCLEQSNPKSAIAIRLFKKCRSPTTSGFTHHFFAHAEHP
jgi:hypothetical protein